MGVRKHMRGGGGGWVRSILTGPAGLRGVFYQKKPLDMNDCRHEWPFYLPFCCAARLHVP